MSNFTQPVCAQCYHKWSGGRTPIKMIGMPTEKCALCGEETREGIYVRLEPKGINFPRYE
jgi:hypothetical protein